MSDLNSQFDWFMNYYLQAKKNYEAACDRYTLLDDEDLRKLSPDEVNDRCRAYDTSYDQLRRESSSLAAFVAANKDYIHFDEGV